MFNKLKIKYIHSSQNVNMIWMTWGSKFRWISFECNLPIWWIPKFQRFDKGIRFGWLAFAFGTGVVSKEQMDSLNNKAIKR